MSRTNLRVGTRNVRCPFAAYTSYNSLSPDVRLPCYSWLRILSAISLPSYSFFSRICSSILCSWFLIKKIVLRVNIIFFSPHSNNVYNYHSTLVSQIDQESFLLFLYNLLKYPVPFLSCLSTLPSIFCCQIERICLINFGL